VLKLSHCGRRDFAESVRECLRGIAVGEWLVTPAGGTMSRQVPLRIVLLKPSKYAADGYVERFRWDSCPTARSPS
jgi:hypothetical protein